MAGFEVFMLPIHHRLSGGKLWGQTDKIWLNANQSKINIFTNSKHDTGTVVTVPTLYKYESFALNPL